MSNGGQLDAASVSSASLVRAMCVELAKELMEQIKDAQSNDEDDEEEFWKQQLAIVLDELVRSSIHRTCRHCCLQCLAVQGPEPEGTDCASAQRH